MIPRDLIAQLDLSPAVASLVDVGLSLVIIFLSALILFWLTKRFFLPIIEKTFLRTRNTWDDVLVRRKFFVSVARLVPLVFLYMAADIFFSESEAVRELIKRGAMAVLILAALQCLNSLLLVIQDIYSFRKDASERPIKGYLTIIKLCFYLFAGIFTVAVLTNSSPWGILSVLGGLTAVLLLIFKDTILGFVASIQLFNLNMVRVGDWIEMPQYGADGDVIDVTIHTVRVQNWDKTITTIPTYAMVSNSFKNWRGMSESGGRRIKRSILIDMNSIRFCDPEMLGSFSRFSLLKEYLTKKQEEIETHNQLLGIDPGIPVNGRRQTNIGVLRAYIKAYLANNPKIHKDMTFLVRQLAPTPTGLPLEIYVFSNDQVWANFEDIQADIFDHILAVVPEFGLRVFQEPSGADFQRLTQNR